MPENSTSRPSDRITATWYWASVHGAGSAVELAGVGVEGGASEAAGEGVEVAVEVGPSGAGDGSSTGVGVSVGSRAGKAQAAPNLGPLCPVVGEGLTPSREEDAERGVEDEGEDQTGEGQDGSAGTDDADEGVSDGELIDALAVPPTDSEQTAPSRQAAPNRPTACQAGGRTIGHSRPPV